MEPDIEPKRHEGHGLALITRDDVLAMADAYRRAGRRAELVGAAGVIGAFAVGALLLQARGLFGWPPSLDPIFLLSGVATAWAAAGLAWRRQRKELAAHQLLCPSCNAAILTVRPWRSEVSRAELVANTGTCPSCGVKILGD